MMWTVKIFKTRAQMATWIKRHGHHYQYEEIAVNNAYGLLVRRTRVIHG